MPILPENRKNLELVILSFFLFLLLSPAKSFGQEIIGWEILADVTYKEKYDEALDWYWLVPVFGKQPEAYQNKRVVLEGYFIPVDRQRSFHVLSRYPYSACFFCGGAGPESVVELQMDEKLTEHIGMDERVRFEGELILNSADFDHLNYIFKAARLFVDRK